MLETKFVYLAQNTMLWFIVIGSTANQCSSSTALHCEVRSSCIQSITRIVHTLSLMLEVGRISREFLVFMWCVPPFSLICSKSSGLHEGLGPIYLGFWAQLYYLHESYTSHVHSLNPRSSLVILINWIWHLIVHSRKNEFGQPSPAPPIPKP